MMIAHKGVKRCFLDVTQSWLKDYSNSFGGVGSPRGAFQNVPKWNSSPSIPLELNTTELTGVLVVPLIKSYLELKEGLLEAFRRPD